jgi:Domain of Unknown Function (DUF1080)
VKPHHGRKKRSRREKANPYLPATSTRSLKPVSLARMKTKTPCRTFLAMAAVLSSFALFAAEPIGAQLSKEWKPLFDGKSLAGWRSLKSETPGVGWKAVDGVLTTSGKAGDLVTTAEFADFELSAEWKIAEGANSGIIYRVGLGEEATYHTGPEYQLLDNAKAADNKLANHLAGSLYDLVAASKDVTKPVGEWNVTRIVVRGWHVEHWLNGVKLLETDLGTPEGKAVVAGSKFKAMPKFATLSRGHIALQDHGDVISFRNILIRELK